MSEGRYSVCERSPGPSQSCFQTRHVSTRRRPLWFLARHPSELECVRDVSSSHCHAHTATGCIDEFSTRSSARVVFSHRPRQLGMTVAHVEGGHHSGTPLLGRLAVDILRLRLPPSIVHALVRQCTTVDPVLVLTRIVFVRGWHLHRGSCGGFVLVVQLFPVSIEDVF